MKKFDLLAASALALVTSVPAHAQTGATTSSQNTAPTNGPGQEAPSSTPTDTQPSAQTNASNQGYGPDIVVTAQRQSQRLQDVPIAVTAFTADNLEKQQIVNPVALQQSLPNITFTKTNFTSSSFTIRGVGDLCTGTTCDSATAIHVNDMPLLATRLFESEFFDLERVEVLRGPQGTLFGRNATSGVVNFITAKPDLSGIHAAGEFEYGNYDSKRVRAMFNLPFTDTLGIRVAGTYLNRNGYTYNEYTGNRIDGRDLYSVRGTLSWEPNPDTRVDLIAYYFHENDDRSRIQKQLCNRDSTGILGCSPDRLANGITNGNSSLASIFTSREFLTVSGAGALAPFALGSVYQTPDAFSGATNPTDVRRVNIDAEPTYFAEEQQYTAKIFHDFGKVSFNFTGGYMENKVDSTTDYTLAVENSYANNAGLNLLNLIGRPGAPGAVLNGVRQTLIPNGTATLCQSVPDANNSGVYGGASVCAPTALDVDRSYNKARQYSAEAHIDSKFDGMFNFLLGGIYFDSKQSNDYYVSAFGLDYASGLIGAGRSGGTSFAATPYYRNSTPLFRLKSYGIFGETYFEFNDRAKLTLGLRYNHDDKFVRARTSLLVDNAVPGLPVLVPIGTTSAFPTMDGGQYDYDATRAGVQPYAEDSVSFSRVTGRAVFDYKITPDNLLYASYSRGYKSGGINPPLSPVFSVPTAFAPESVDAYEIGSKNTFGGGAFRLNLTGFYYKYKNLQLSRIVARTSVNDNVNADIYGVEAEAVVSPIPRFVVNMNASYLKTKVADDRFLANPRDPSGGRSDAVIIKDITTAANCAVVPTTAGNAAGANAFVNTINRGIGASFGNANLLQGTVAVPGTNTTGAFSICSALTAQAAAVGAAFGGIQVLGSGVETNIRGNQLPNAPTYKWSVGAQYTIDFADSGFTLVPRVDLNYTGNAWGTVFNKNPIDRLPGYEVVNAQIQLNAPDDRFYVRGFVSNLTKNNATTGLYVTDQSSGLYTNIFTIEPRRYGVAAGFKF
ncbi:TonB-dependent receptor [uncultured Sphingomonas sp.]|uniref:TonB-dependent receptor n=1 Tax=uncultured Sphingomonas sp. TaxID=158754 RepID=UPI00260002EE|nr:TonB-dependent receptor [uncultured Sphingomonas sp.]